MSFRDYAKFRGYKILDTPESVIEELQEIAMHYRALEEKNIEACRNSQKEYIHIISWLEILEFKHEWFSLSILGLNLPKNFINGVMMSAFKDKAFAEIAAHLQLAVYVQQFPQTLCP